VRKPQ